MKRYDVIVIGMGLAGLMAAKTAADNGRNVLLIGKGVGTAHILTGCIDVLGYYPPQSPVSVESPFESLSRLADEIPNHPYAWVGVPDIRRALRSFLGLFDDNHYTYLSQGQKNAIALTPSGSTRATYLFPSTMEWGGVEDERDVLIVGFDGLKDFYGALVAHNLNSLREQGHISFSARSISLRLSRLSDRSVAPPPVLGRFFEDDGFRDRVAGAVGAHRKGEGRVAFPAVLGVEKPQEVKRELEAKLGATVFEIPTLPPSVPASRLVWAFKKYLRGKGVTTIMGFPVVGAVVRNGRCLEVSVACPPIQRTYSADLYILATGRFAGGGLEVRGDRVVEPIFDLPVHQPFPRENWFRDRFFSHEPHPIEGFGLMVNEELNPVDDRGHVVVTNFRVAGSILSHGDALREKSGAGVAVATGYKAGKGEAP